MYTNPGRKPTWAQLDSKGELLAKAKADQAKDLADEKTLTEATSPSKGEEHQRIQQQVGNLAEMGECSA